MKRILLLSLFVCIGSVSVAQSLEECCRLAREHYPEIRKYALIEQSARYDLSNAARAWLPQVALSAQASYQSATPELPEQFGAMLAQQGVNMNGLQKDQYKVAVDVNQSVWDGGLSRATRGVTRAESSERKLATDVELYDLNRRVEEIYFGLLLLGEQQQQVQLKIELLGSNLRRLKALCSNGVALQADVDAVEVEILSAEQSLDQVRTAKQSYLRMLGLFIGRTVVASELQRPSVESVKSRQSSRVELAWLDAKSDVLKAQERLVSSSTMPRVSAFVQSYYGYPSMDYFKSMITTDWTLNAIVGVRMSWNFGAYYTKRNNLNRLRTAQQQIEVQRDIFLFNNNLQVVSEDENILRIRKAIETDERIVELRRSVREASESKIENGVIETTELLQKITEESSAMLACSSHEIELLQAIYRLKHTLNQ